MEYGRDVSIGPKVVAQSAETLRKLRNTVRFMLANLKDGDAVRGDFRRATKEELSLVCTAHCQRKHDWRLIIVDHSQIDRYVMLHLQQLENTCREAYSDYNFPRGAPHEH